MIATKLGIGVCAGFLGLVLGGLPAAAQAATKYKRFKAKGLQIQAPAHWKAEQAAGGLTILRGRTGKLYLWIGNAGTAKTRDLWNRFLKKVVGERIGRARVGKYREKTTDDGTAGFALVDGKSRINKQGERGTGPGFHFAVLMEKRGTRAFGAALGGTRGAGYGKQIRRLKRILGSLKVKK